MGARVKWLIVLALGAMLSGAALPAHADEGEDEHEVARELYEHGQIASLEAVLARLRQTNAGEVVGVDLIRLGDKWVYRFQVIAPDGRRELIDIDAGPASSTPDNGDD